MKTYTEADFAAAIASAEAPWRELLFMNHDQYTPGVHSRYGDDGEMQCCGLDFKRASAEFIAKALAARQAAASTPDSTKEQE